MTSGIDGINDRVLLKFAGAEAIAVETYEVKIGIVTQPAAFALTLGYGGAIADLMKRTMPGTKFELFIGDHPQFSGVIDGHSVRSDANGASLSVNGRDHMAKLHDSRIKAHRAFSDVTFRQLTEAVLAEVYGNEWTLYAGNEANRKTITGSGPAPKEDSNMTALRDDLRRANQSGANDAVLATLDAVTLQGKNCKAIQAKPGESWYQVLRREHDRSGCFLWAGAQGEFVFAVPNTKQRPTYRFVRRRGQARGDTNVIAATYVNDTSKRFSEALVYGRKRSSIDGATKAEATYEDAEMKAIGMDRPLVIVDPHCSSTSKAQFLARKAISESRREGYHLSYLIAGHSTLTPQGETAVIAVDTMAQVIDEEFGLDRLFYIEAVTHRRNPKSTTEITLLRPEDMVFGEPPE